MAWRGWGGVGLGLAVIRLGEVLEDQATWYSQEAAPIGGSRDTVMMAEADACPSLQGVNPCRDMGAPTSHHKTRMRFGGRF